jgi:hypothetical protein
VLYDFLKLNFKARSFLFLILVFFSRVRICFLRNYRRSNVNRNAFSTSLFQVTRYVVFTVISLEYKKKNSNMDEKECS